MELRTHEDEYPNKRPITAEELEFLADLQHRINTQDHIGQADPRYWVIKDERKIYGSDLNNVNGFTVIERGRGDSDEYFEGENVRYEELTDIIKKGLCEREYFDSKQADEYEFNQKAWDEILEASYDIDSLIENINENNTDGLKFEVFEYSTYDEDSNVFFSHKEAKEYLQANKHHYSNKAYTYAMTTGSNDIRKLIKLLHEVDFNSLLKKMKNEPCSTDKMDEILKIIRHTEAYDFEFRDGEVEIQFNNDGNVVVAEYSESQQAAMLRKVIAPRDSFTDDEITQLHKLCNDKNWNITD